MVQIVGILNITPDSFSDGNLYFDTNKAILRTHQLFEEGANLVDIGAESTRPGAQPLTPDQEWERLEPVLCKLINEFPHSLSVDTYHPETAEAALNLGDVIINDVTGLNNPKMISVILKFKAKIVISHSPDINVQLAHRGKLIGDIQQIRSELLDKALMLESKGLKHENIILDPGIGFGKTMKINRELLSFAKLIKEYPVMIGYSKKRFLGDNRMKLKPNIAAGKIAIKSGAAYIRVHDVKSHAEQLLK